MQRARYKAEIFPSGYIYILLTMVLGIGVANTGNNLLYLMSGLMLALMILSGLTSFWNLLFLEIDLLGPDEVFADIPARFRLVVQKKRWSSFFLSFETAFGSARLPFVSGVTELTTWLTFPARGRATIESLSISSGFPLGFFRRHKVLPGRYDVLVYPRPLPREFPAPAVETRGETVCGLDRNRSDEIMGIRGYRENDPLRWVDWKATARKGDLMVREFYRLNGEVLHIQISKKDMPQEQQISEACYLVLEGSRMGFSICLSLPPEKTVGPGRGEVHRRALLEALAYA